MTKPSDEEFDALVEKRSRRTRVIAWIVIISLILVAVAAVITLVESYETIVNPGRNVIE